MHECFANRYYIFVSLVITSCLRTCCFESPGFIWECLKYKDRALSYHFLIFLIIVFVSVLAVFILSSLNRFASLHSLSLKASQSHRGHNELLFFFKAKCSPKPQKEKHLVSIIVPDPFCFAPELFLMAITHWDSAMKVCMGLLNRTPFNAQVKHEKTTDRTEEAVLHPARKNLHICIISYF